MSSQDEHDSIAPLDGDGSVTKEDSVPQPDDNGDVRGKGIAQPRDDNSATREGSGEEGLEKRLFKGSGEVPLVVEPQLSGSGAPECEHVENKLQPSVKPQRVENQNTGIRRAEPEEHHDSKRVRRVVVAKRPPASEVEMGAELSCSLSDEKPKSAQIEPVQTGKRKRGRGEQITDHKKLARCARLTVPVTAV